MRVLLAIVVSLLAAGGGAVSAGAARTGTFADTFAGGHLDVEAWKPWWGQATVADGDAVLTSDVPKAADVTHSSLVTTKETWSDFDLRLTLGSTRQLRHPRPNPWETAWVMFDFRDLHDYYYFIVKPNGWELGKKQGSDAQIFLATGTSPVSPIGDATHLRIVDVDHRIQVYDDGRLVVTYVDPHPLVSGAVGMYEEDSVARFSAVSVTPLRPPIAFAASVRRTAPASSGPARNATAAS